MPGIRVVVSRDIEPLSKFIAHVIFLEILVDGGDIAISKNGSKRSSDQVK
jgi:hypothetical protein